MKATHKLHIVAALAGLPDTKVGAFTHELYDWAVIGNALVISMKNDWKHIFVEGVADGE